MDTANAMRSAGNGITTCYFEKEPGVFEGYNPIQPCADNDELATLPRLILRHDRGVGPTIKWVREGDLHAGWVIGVGTPASNEGE